MSSFLFLFVINEYL